jgi:LysM repeat protein
MTLGRAWIPAARTLMLLLALGAAVTGCVRTAEGPREEQKNPFYLAGKERLQAMDYHGAAESFERALQENPKSVLTHYELGVLYDQHLADFAAALYHYNKALKLRPSGYPADNVRYRIPACRQELVKADSLAVLNPSALRDMEKLREENHELRRQLGELRAALVRSAGGSAPAPGPAESGTTMRLPPAGTISGLTTTGMLTTGGATPAGRSATNSPANPSGRTHVVRPGDTVASISRQYNVRIPAILAANRGLDPKRLKIGQLVQVPSSSSSAGPSR